ncbi:hypothetical protein FRC09_005058 [Ceratobasidium sp. 395]|nr:hypothetical protein FRC09_005058 [Ceratobasidium sp. 395]
MLQSLFNVHTLKVYYTHPTIGSALKDAFKGRHLASIRTVVMPNYAYEVLRRCQGVEHITCTYGDGGKLAAAVVEAGCSSLQVLQYISPTSAILKRLRKANPPLRCVRVKPHVPGKSEEAVIRDWTDFPLLRTIEIQCSEDKLDALKLVKVAKEVLRTCAERESIIELKTPRRSRVDVQEAQSASIDLGTDLRVVKVRYAPGYNY